MIKKDSFFSKKIELRIPVWVIAAAPFLLYLLWELFWFNRVKWNFVKWHTHIMVYAYLWLTGLAVFLAVRRACTSELFKNLFLAFSSVILILALAEVYLHIDGRNKTYLEKVNGNYTSPYTPLDIRHYHTWAPDKPHLIKKPEYSFMFPTNSLGMPDVEWKKHKKANEYRILTLGDSFTEGDGAPYDSSYPSQLARMLKTAGDTTVMIMNGGICGSDPYFNFIAFRDLLLPYHPDMVIQELASEDITTNIIIRGGMERFTSDGKQQFKSAPWWEPIYALSYLSRFYFKHKGYSELLRNKPPSTTEAEQMNRQLKKLFSVYDSLCLSNNIQLVVFLKPDREEIMQSRYSYDLEPIKRFISDSLRAKVFDLLPFYQDYIRTRKSDVKEYFWVNDGHHNARGYRMMASGIYQYLLNQEDSLLHSQLMLRGNLQHPVN